MRHVSEGRGAERFGVKIGVVKFAVYLACLDLSKGYLLFDIIDDHQEVLEFLGIACVIVGHCNDGTVVFHDDCREFEGYLEFLAESDDEVDFFGEGKDSTGLCVGRGCSDGLEGEGGCKRFRGCH